MLDPLAKTACGLTEAEVWRIMEERVDAWVRKKIAARPDQHGTLGYWRGCRCDVCKDGGRAYRAHRKAG